MDGSTGEALKREDFQKMTYYPKEGSKEFLCTIRWCSFWNIPTGSQAEASSEYVPSTRLGEFQIESKVKSLIKFIDFNSIKITF